MKLTETKSAANLQVGDRICYTAGQVEYNTFGSKHAPLSGEVVSIEKREDGRYTISTPSGRLKSVSGDVEFEIIGPDYPIGLTQSSWWKKAETYSGVSIE